MKKVVALTVIALLLIAASGFTGVALAEEMKQLNEETLSTSQTAGDAKEAVIQKGEEILNKDELLKEDEDVADKDEMGDETEENIKEDVK